MADAQVKVTTEKLLSAAEGIAAQRNRLAQQSQSWTTRMRKLCDGWQGEASGQVKELARVMGVSTNTILSTLDGYVSVLREVAGVYGRTEQQVKARNDTLPTTGVFR